MTRDFWEAVIEGDLEEARELAIDTDERGWNRLADQGITEVEVGELLSEGQEARVETRLVRERGDLVFPTRLRKFDQGWRIDARATGGALREALLQASMDDLGDAFADSADVVSEAIERGLQEASDALRDAMKELEPAPAPPATQP